MHVVLVSKAMVVGTYRRKAEAIARCGVELTVLAPPAWRDRRGEQVAAPHHAAGYAFHILPIRFNGSFHLHYYPTLGRELRRLRPDLLHMDEEPYNLATYLALAEARRLKVPALFFTWQNLYRRYPPPFAWFEQANYRRAAYAIAGSQEAAAVLARKGYRGPLAVLPQFGVDPTFFRPAPDPRIKCFQMSGASRCVDPTFFRPAPDLPTAGGPLRIGYAGGLLPEKGVDLLLRACAGLAGDWRLAIVGEGSEQAALAGLAEALNIRERVSLAPRLPGEAMPGFYQGLDVFVLPSRTRPNWKEQFGRVLVEAMACGVAVVGSDTGEIPHVIGDAGLLFAENDVEALRAQLQRLLDDPAARADLAARGRDRVLAHFTMDQVAARTVEIYREILGESRRGERDA